MGAELRRKREGKRTETGMSESQLRDFAKKPVRKRKRRKKKHGEDFPMPDKHGYY